LVAFIWVVPCCKKIWPLYIELIGSLPNQIPLTRHYVHRQTRQTPLERWWQAPAKAGVGAGHCPRAHRALLSAALRNRMIAAGVALVIVVVVVAVVVGVVLSKSGDESKGGGGVDRGPAGSPGSASSPTPSPTSSGSTLSNPAVGSDGCTLISDGLSTAFDNLDIEFDSAIDDCGTSSCTIDLSAAQSYSDSYFACREAQGAFHVYAMEILCDTLTYEINNIPACWVSERANSACAPVIHTDALESQFDVTNCTDTATHTGTEDFSV
jgi:hypothetical protein